MKSVFTIFFLLFFQISYSQIVELTGVAIIGNSQMSKYMIVYEMNDDNTIKGYSVSDIGGDSETKAKINGFFNPRKKTLRFEEKNIISSKLNLSFNDFCLMSVTGKFDKKNDKQIFTAHFVSKSPNYKLSCDSGTMILTTTENALELAAKFSKSVEKIALPDTIKKIIYENLPPVKPVEKIKSIQAGSITKYTLLSDTVQLDIFDDKLQDGDKITVLKNNVEILSDFETTKKVQSLKFVIDKNEASVLFTIIATDEGSSPPNTVKVFLINGNEKVLLIAPLKKGQMVKIMLQRKGKSN